ncbi:hippurate hydrolase [Psychromicrobium silvestre]|uniref:Hippurate hydrolase n=1 Tax=Psychromicrobium silvestre TaxID=1645614 RepID=A0A7Y9LTM5_9MICC|nr:M20 family metallopeptidase [Psychromicrobium silvestre]NYE95382.1 hippurate hydrolase [Psychromicrobium silvestre]NYE95398.1 hippurate hydrolase [Psychromicrobium silvestre]
MTTRTQELAAEFAPEMIALRRDLHQNPEIGLDLPQTQRRILEALEPLDLEITLGKGLSSVTAVLRGGAAPNDAQDRPVVLLRGDMDGLPVTELVDVPFKSTNGAMHACGHDLHVAGLVGAAKILHAVRQELPGDVVFMFQPGEEGPGGAKPMIDEGVLDAAGKRADAAYGLHVMSDQVPRGMWIGKPKTLMASPDTLRVKFIGQGGHGSRPFQGNDPVPALCEAVLALQTMVTRHFDIFDPIVVTVGRIAAGSKENIIPDSAEFDATVRSFSPESRAKAEELSVALLKGIATAHGLEAEVEFEHVYPVTVNDEVEFAFTQGVVEDLFGAERFHLLENPIPGGEDFSFVLEEVPGTYIFLSACAHEDLRKADGNHSPRAAFDDVVLPDGAALLAELAVRRLNRADS